MRMLPLVLLLASAVVLAEDTKAVDAKALVLAARDALDKQQGYHLAAKGNYALGDPNTAMTYGAETIVKGDLAWSKEEQMGIPTETFRKGTKIIFKDATDGEWKDAQESGGLPTGGLQDPKIVLKLLDKTSDTAEVAGEEKVRDIDCIRVALHPKPEVLKDFLASVGIPDLGLDFSKGKIEFQLWVGKEDKFFHRMALKGELEMATAEEDPPQPGAEKMEPIKVMATIEVELFDYNKNLEFEIPDKVKKLLGL